jgi:hypothetical protein
MFVEWHFCLLFLLHFVYVSFKTDKSMLNKLLFDVLKYVM